MVGIFRITGSKVSCEDSFSLDLCIHTLVVDNASNASNLSWILRLPSTTSTCACQLTITAAGSCTVLGSQVLNAQNPRHRFMADSIRFFRLFHGQNLRLPSEVSVQVHSTIELRNWVPEGSDLGSTPDG